MSGVLKSVRTVKKGAEGNLVAVAKSMGCGYRKGTRK